MDFTRRSRGSATRMLNIIQYPVCRIDNKGVCIYTHTYFQSKQRGLSSRRCGPFRPSSTASPHVRFCAPHGSKRFDVAHPNPIRFPYAPNDVPALLSLASHQILTAAPLLIPRLFVTAAIPLLIRRPTLLKSLNLQIQRSRGITVVYVRSSSARIGGTPP